MTVCTCTHTTDCARCRAAIETTCTGCRTTLDDWTVGYCEHGRPFCVACSTSDHCTECRESA